MKVVNLSTTDDGGGAARAATRLHAALLKAGADSHVLVQRNDGWAPGISCGLNVVERVLSGATNALEFRIARYFQGAETGPFSINAVPNSLLSNARRLQPDVLNLHWINGGFLRIEALRHWRGPIVWTLHDSWPFTGGCHLPGECHRYESHCGECPVVGPKASVDLASWVFQRKRRAWATLRLTIVAPSQAMAESARRSTLFGRLPVVHIPNGIDTGAFKPLPKTCARTALNLPAEGRVVLFATAGSLNDSNKGLALLSDALRKLQAMGLRVTLLLLGTGQPHLQGFDGEKMALGRLRDDLSMSIVYSAADVTAIPSYYENLPNVALESLACGTPIAGFDTPGLREIVTNPALGALAPRYDAAQLATGIASLLSSRSEGQCARREHVEQVYCVSLQAARYSALYREVLL